MGLANLSSCKENYQEIQEKSNQILLDMKSDSFTVDLETLSHHGNKDITHSSRINMERSLSRKGSQVRPDKKMINSSSLMIDGDRETIPTPKASLIATSMPGKLMLVNPNADHILDPQLHHQITITTAAGTPTTTSLFGKKSSSFKQSSSIINPRRILFFFATLSSMGTILLICLTLSMAKYNEDDKT